MRISSGNILQVQVSDRMDLVLCSEKGPHHRQSTWSRSGATTENQVKLGLIHCKRMKNISRNRTDWYQSLWMFPPQIKRVQQ